MINEKFTVLYFTSKFTGFRGLDQEWELFGIPIISCMNTVGLDIDTVQFGYGNKICCSLTEIARQVVKIVHK